MSPRFWKKALFSGLLILAVGVPTETPRAAPPKKTSTKKSSPAKAAGEKKPAVRKGGERWFLSHAEFSSLTRSEQKQYLKGVKKVLSSLPEKSSSFAGTTPSPGRGVASEVKLLSSGVERLVAQAEEWRGHPPPLYEYMDEERHEEFRGKWRNSMWWLITARVTHAKIPDSDPGKTAVGKRISELEDFYLSARKVSETSFAKNDELKEVYTRLRQAKNGEVDFNTPGLIPSGALVDVQGGQKIAWNSPPAAEEKPPEEKPAEKGPRVIDLSAERPPASPEPEALPSLRGYRCMYAGFVIRQDPCRGPRELPDEMGFKGIDSSRLVCDEGRILCNPLLFGLKTTCPFGNETPESEILTCLASGAPLCVPRGKFATRDCGTQSASEGQLASAAALIRANPEVWNEYLLSFYELCDDKMIVLNEFAQIRDGEPRPIPQSTLADIEQTCTNAKKQLRQIADDYRIETGRPDGPQAPASTPDKTEGQQ